MEDALLDEVQLFDETVEVLLVVVSSLVRQRSLRPALRIRQT